MTAPILILKKFLDGIPLTIVEINSEFTGFGKTFEVFYISLSSSDKLAVLGTVAKEAKLEAEKSTSSKTYKRIHDIYSELKKEKPNIAISECSDLERMRKDGKIKPGDRIKLVFRTGTFGWAKKNGYFVVEPVEAKK